MMATLCRLARLAEQRARSMWSGSPVREVRRMTSTPARVIRSGPRGARRRPACGSGARGRSVAFAARVSRRAVEDIGAGASCIRASRGRRRRRSRLVISPRAVIPIVPGLRRRCQAVDGERRSRGGAVSGRARPVELETPTGLQRSSRRWRSTPAHGASGPMSRRGGAATSARVRRRSGAGLERLADDDVAGKGTRRAGAHRRIHGRATPTSAGSASYADRQPPAERCWRPRRRSAGRRSSRGLQDRQRGRQPWRGDDRHQRPLRRRERVGSRIRRPAAGPAQATARLASRRYGIGAGAR